MGSNSQGSNGSGGPPGGIGPPGRTRPPESAKDLSVSVQRGSMTMKDATVSWTWPTKRDQGGNLPESDIAEMEISLSADGGANFTELTTPGEVTPPTTSFVQTELSFGDYIFRLVVIDTLG